MANFVYEVATLQIIDSVPYVETEIYKSVESARKRFNNRVKEEMSVWPFREEDTVMDSSKDSFEIYVDGEACENSTTITLSAKPIIE